MAVRRMLPLVLVLAALPVQPAPGQSLGAAQPPDPPPACRHLLTIRDEVQTNANALRTAGQTKAGPEEACKLFKAFLASEAKMIKGLEDHSALCGVPPGVITQVKAQHVQAEKHGKRLCEAAQRPRPPGPGDALPWCFATLRPGLSCVLAADK
jgi:hypothetical protein